MILSTDWYEQRVCLPLSLSLEIVGYHGLLLVVEGEGLQCEDNVSLELYRIRKVQRQLFGVAMVEMLQVLAYVFCCLPVAVPSPEFCLVVQGRKEDKMTK